MQKALFTGTFDPPTLGHIELIKRAHLLFDFLIVGIGQNISKTKPILTIDERKSSLEKATKEFANVEIQSFKGLVTNFAQKNEIEVLIRGIRSEADLNYELQMAEANREISGIETIFFPATGGSSNISSTLIRELASHGAPLDKFIPKELEKIMQTKSQ